MKTLTIESLSTSDRRAQPGSGRQIENANHTCEQRRRCKLRLPRTQKAGVGRALHPCSLLQSGVLRQNARERTSASFDEILDATVVPEYSLLPGKRGHALARAAPSTELPTLGTTQGSTSATLLDAQHLCARPWAHPYVRIDAHLCAGAMARQPLLRDGCMGAASRVMTKRRLRNVANSCENDS